MKTRYNLLILSVLALMLTSCEDDGYADYDPGNTNAQELSGEWYISVYSLDGERITGYYELSTYNTAENNNTIFVDDNGSLFPLKVKANGNIDALTFDADNVENLYNAESIATITEGKIIPDGAKASGSNTVVDSLSFQVELADDPDSPYLVAGYRNTGFEEDEH